MSKTILTDVDGFTPLPDLLVSRYDVMTAAIWGKVWRYCQMKDGICRASIETLAGELNINRMTFIRHIETLVKDGFLLDTTPELRNKPHIYADTGKVSMYNRFGMGVSTITKSDSETEVTVTKSDPAITKSDSRYNKKLLEDSIKDTIKDTSGENSKKGTGLAFIELNQQNLKKQKELEDMINRFEAAMGVRPSMSNPKWETVIKKLLKLEPEGQTIEQYAAWANANRYDAPKIAQIATRPTIILDTWTAAFRQRELVADGYREL